VFQVTLNFDSPQQAIMVAAGMESAARQIRVAAAERGETRPTNPGIYKATALEAQVAAIYAAHKGTIRELEVVA
jgi:hypothetical protein